MLARKQEGRRRAGVSFGIFGEAGAGPSRPAFFFEAGESFGIFGEAGAGPSRPASFFEAGGASESSEKQGQGLKAHVLFEAGAAFEIFGEAGAGPAG